MKLQSPVALLACIIIFAYSCSKTNDATNKDAETQTAADNSLAESTSNDAVVMSQQSEANGVTGTVTDSTAGFMLSPCADVTLNFIASPLQLTIDFGANNCLCYDGKYRRGKLLVTYTGLYRDSASVHTISYDNYYVNNYKVEGTTTVTNTGHNTKGNIVFDVQANETITDSTGSKLTYTSSRKREWIAGESTQGITAWTDDVYSITGSASGTTFTGKTFKSDITSALIVALNCRWIEAGKIDFTPDGELTRTIDFGNGDCDNKITVSIAGISFDILLP